MTIPNASYYVIPMIELGREKYIMIKTKRYEQSTLEKGVVEDDVTLHFREERQNSPGFRTHIPPPESKIDIVPPRPQRGAVLIPGYWHFNEYLNQYYWVKGYWETRPGGCRWVPGLWSFSSGFYSWTSGFWVD